MIKTHILGFPRIGAQRELKVALEGLLARYGGFESTGPHEWTPNNRLFGLKHLPVLGVPREEPAR